MGVHLLVVMSFFVAQISWGVPQSLQPLQFESEARSAITSIEFQSSVLIQSLAKQSPSETCLKLGMLKATSDKLQRWFWTYEQKTPEMEARLRNLGRETENIVNYCTGRFSKRVPKGNKVRLGKALEVIHRESKAFKKLVDTGDFG